MEKDTHNKEDFQVYELGYLFVPSLTEDKVEEEVKTLHTLVTSLGASIISSENPLYIDLAYAITKHVGATRHKYNKAYIGWVKFEMTPEHVVALKKELDLSSSILRYLITKTVRENTLLNGKMVFQVEEPEADLKEVISEVVEGEDVSLGEEELDKSIDELVTA
jgi:ribosomal protein S6